MVNKVNLRSVYLRWQGMSNGGAITGGLYEVLSLELHLDKIYVHFTNREGHPDFAHVSNFSVPSCSRGRIWRAVERFNYEA